MNHLTLRNLRIVGSREDRLSQVLALSRDPRMHRNLSFENVTFENVSLVVGYVGAPMHSTSGAAANLALASGVRSDVQVSHSRFKGYAADGALWVQGADNVTISDSELSQIGRSGALVAGGASIIDGDMIKFSYHARGGRIMNNHLHDGRRDAIDLFDAIGVLVSGNQISDMGVSAVEAKYSTHDRVVGGHTIINNRATRVSQANRSVNAVAYQVSTSNTTVVGNVVSDSYGSGFRVGPAMDNARDLPSGTRLEGNRVVNVTGQGFVTAPGAGVTLVNNITEG